MKNILNKALEVADSAEIYKRDIFSTSVDLVLGSIQSIESEKKTEISLKIIKDGKAGMAVATSLEDETLVERALISLKYQASESDPFLNESYHPVQSACDETKALSTEDLVEAAMSLYRRYLEKAPDLDMLVNYSKTVKHVHLMNTEGFDGHYDYTNITAGTFTLNKQGFHCTSNEISSAKMPEFTDAQIDQQIHLHKLDAQPIELGTERMPVIFAGKVMGSLMLRVLGGVNGGNVVKEISPLCGKLGEKVFSDKLTIRDDGTMPYGANTVAFDDEGTPSQNTVFIENGVLKSYLMTAKQAKKLGMKATGNAIKKTLFSNEIEDAPSVNDTNFIIEGEMMPDEALFKKVKRGLYITGVMGSHTGNINQGEFSMNISSGFLIEDGQLTGKVKGAMIAGNIYDLFTKIDGIGNEYETMRGLFYVMGYSPKVLFSEMNIVGK